MSAANDPQAPANRLEALDDFLDELEARNEQVPILVEGPKDAAALRELGITGKVQVVHTGQSLVALVETLDQEGVREVILLTDWDRTGGRIHRRLRELLDTHVIKWSDRERQALGRIVGNDVRTVESVPRLRETLLRRAVGTKDLP